MFVNILILFKKLFLDIPKSYEDLHFLEKMMKMLVAYTRSKLSNNLQFGLERKSQLVAVKKMMLLTYFPE